MWHKLADKGHGKTVGHSSEESLAWREPLLRSSCRLYTAIMGIWCDMKCLFSGGLIMSMTCNQAVLPLPRCHGEGNHLAKFLPHGLQTNDVPTPMDALVQYLRDI